MNWLKIILKIQLVNIVFFCQFLTNENPVLSNENSVASEVKNALESFDSKVVQELDQLSALKSELKPESEGKNQVESALVQKPEQEPCGQREESKVIQKSGTQYQYPSALVMEFNGKRFPLFKIRSWGQIYIDQMDKDCLVITDIDQTLIEYGDCLPRHLYSSGRYCQDAKEAVSMMLRLYKKASWPEICYKIFSDTNADLIELYAKVVLDILYQKGIPTIACTACSSDQDFITQRAERLSVLGIRFYLPMYFEGFRAGAVLKKWRGDPWYKKPCFYEKMLITDQLLEKGPMIISFIKAACPEQYWPKKIILIDDSFYNIEQTAQECARQGFGFVGYHYENDKSKDIPWNLDMVMFQLKILFEKGFWMRDKAAKNLYVKSVSTKTKTQLNKP